MSDIPSHPCCFFLRLSDGKDASGRKYTLHLGAQSLAGAGLPDDELQPGEKVRDQIGFQVPKSAHGLIFVFDAEVIGFGKAFIALQ